MYLIFCYYYDRTIVVLCLHDVIQIPKLKWQTKKVQDCPPVILYT